MLFGSRARGEPGKASDFDLLIEGPRGGEGAWARLICDVEYEALTLRHVDLVHSEEAPESLLHRARREGVVLDER